MIVPFNEKDVYNRDKVRLHTIFETLDLLTEFGWKIVTHSTHPHSEEDSVQEEQIQRERRTECHCVSLT